MKPQTILKQAIRATETLLVYLQQLDKPDREPDPTLPPESPARPEIPLSPEAEVRLEALKQWRRQHASQEGRPSFHVFSNRTLRELAEKRPTNIQELKTVFGVGPAKLEAYGDAVLNLLEDL